MNDDYEWVGKIIAFFLWFLLLPLIAWGIEVSWNAVIPFLFHLPALTYWKALALGFLFMLLK